MWLTCYSMCTVNRICTFTPQALYRSYLMLHRDQNDKGVMLTCGASSSISYKTIIITCGSIGNVPIFKWIFALLKRKESIPREGGICNQVNNGPTERSLMMYGLDAVNGIRDEQTFSHYSIVCINDFPICQDSPTDEILSEMIAIWW